VAELLFQFSHGLVQAISDREPRLPLAIAG